MHSTVVNRDANVIEERPLSGREAAFSRRYLISHNATKAAIEAGYATSSAHVAGHRLLGRPHVRTEIERREAKALRDAAQVGGLLTNAKGDAKVIDAGGDAPIARRAPKEDADTVASATRTYVLAALIENLEIALGRRKRRVATRGLTQEALADTSGLNRTYLSSVERAERNVSIDNIARIARALEVDASELLLDRGRWFGEVPRSPLGPESAG